MFWYHQGLLHPCGWGGRFLQSWIGKWLGLLDITASTVGAEKGVTTGRSRRCGWFDAALLKRSAQVNGLSGLCITKLDVLDGLPN